MKKIITDVQVNKVDNKPNSKGNWQKYPPIIFTKSLQTAPTARGLLDILLNHNQNEKGRNE